MTARRCAPNKMTQKQLCHRWPGVSVQNLQRGLYIFFFLARLAGGALGDLAREEAALLASVGGAAERRAGGGGRSCGPGRPGGGSGCGPGGHSQSFLGHYYWLWWWWCWFVFLEAEYIEEWCVGCWMNYFCDES